LQTRDQLIADIKSLIVEVLALEDIRPDEIETDAPLFIEGLGLDSIDALELAMGLEEKYGVIITDDPERNEVIFASVATLADLVTAERLR
jgi:acyl carrier protein